MTNRIWDKDREHFRTTLKMLRNRAGLTQKSLSDKLGKPQSYVSKYENGERKLDYVEIYNICREIGVSMSELNMHYEIRN